MKPWFIAGLLGLITLGFYRACSVDFQASGPAAALAQRPSASSQAGELQGLLARLELARSLKVHFLNVQEMGPHYTKVQAVVSNTTDRMINRAVVAAVLLDSATNQIGFIKDTVVYSYDPPLAPGATLHHEFIGKMAVDRVAFVRFEVEQVQ